MLYLLYPDCYLFITKRNSSILKLYKTFKFSKSKFSYIRNTKKSGSVYLLREFFKIGEFPSRHSVFSAKIFTTDCTFATCTYTTWRYALWNTGSFAVKFRWKFLERFFFHFLFFFFIFVSSVRHSMVIGFLRSNRSYNTTFYSLRTLQSNCR